MKVALAALMMATGAALDLATKAWARSSLEPYGPASDFLPFVSLRLTFNEGVSFSMLAFEGESGQALLLGATGLLTLIMAGWAYRSRGWQRVALSLVTAGAMGNLFDRAARGTVTDFLGLHFGDWHPFVFNLADVWISAGACVLLAASLAQGKKNSAIS
ncbi:MAG TPA: signal peptidase II [Agrobacterium sp.]|uniref:Lipoprotein signal peptidase n=2 Tax=Brucella TaxID=234 RepID=A0A256GD98_9HYPH|nr:MULTISPECIES: signal peptidase II [Alphaproteobacteria]HBT69143.1 signal peptidase II [Agrobacterium sp.]KAB2758428.1 signal peptidase II [Brucella anthropi]MDH0370020.1 signal peptidase II [Brucella anthropi]OYR25097.1 signal peptidase II [Brucella grignonensis]RRY01809.1 signal peptidase II [Brucella anthropi]